MKDAVKRGKLLPQDATHDELRAYNMLASDVTKKARLALERKRRFRTTSTIFRQTTPERREEDDGQGSPPHRPRYNDLHRRYKETITHNLINTFKLADNEEEKKEPKTPTEALLSV